MEIYCILLSVVLPLVAAMPQQLKGPEKNNEKKESLTERPSEKAHYHTGTGYLSGQAVYPAGTIGFNPGSSGYPGFGVYYPGGYNPSGGNYPGYYPAGGSYPGYYPGSYPGYNPNGGNPGYNPNGGNPGYNPNGGSPGYNPNGGSPGYNPNGGNPGYNPSDNNPEDPEFEGEGGKIPNGIPVDNDVEIFEVPPNRRGGQPSGGYPGYPGGYPGYPG